MLLLTFLLLPWGPALVNILPILVLPLLLVSRLLLVSLLMLVSLLLLVSLPFLVFMLLCGILLLTSVKICRRRVAVIGENLPPSSLIPVANLPPVANENLRKDVTTGVLDADSTVNFDLRISLRIFEKFEMTPTRGLREGNSWGKPEANNLVKLSL